MKLTLTNRGALAVPVTSTDEGGWSVLLQPGVAQEIDRTGSDVWIIGDKPGHLENIAKGLQTLLEVITRWRERKVESGGAILVEVVNTGSKGVRIVPGNVEGEQNVSAGDTTPRTISTTDGYIELRELGA